MLTDGQDDDPPPTSYPAKMQQIPHMLLGIISDTHGFLDPRVPPLLKGVDHILHAGDIGKNNIIPQLSSIAPVTAVRGNNDRQPPESDYPEELTLTLQGCRIYLTHQVKVPKSPASRLLKPYRDANVQVVISGHSHIPLQKQIESILFFNPGSAGKPRFKTTPSLGLLQIQNGRPQGSIHPL